MTAAAAFLVSLSVLMHVGWNALSKRRHPSAAFFFVATGAGALLLLPALLLDAARVLSVPAQVWWVLAATGVCQACYMVSLAAAYRAGDLSLAYPLARSIPPVLVALAALPLGRAQRIDPVCAAGIALIAIGALLIPRDTLRDLHWHDYRTPCAALALLAAFGVAGYSLLDDYGLHLLQDLPLDPFSTTEATLVYGALEGLSTALFLGLWVVLHPGERLQMTGLGRSELGFAARLGVVMYLSYLLILGAMSFVSDVSYVVALRQLSVPVGALVGVRFLGEPGPLPKLIGVGFCFAGLLLVVLG